MRRTISLLSPNATFTLKAATALIMGASSENDDPSTKPIPHIGDSRSTTLAGTYAYLRGSLPEAGTVSHFPRVFLLPQSMSIINPYVPCIQIRFHPVSAQIVPSIGIVFRASKWNTIYINQYNISTLDVGISLLFWDSQPPKYRGSRRTALKATSSTKSSKRGSNNSRREPYIIGLLWIGDACVR